MNKSFLLQFIRSTHWPSAELWIGLGWVNGRLQWMSQIPRNFEQYL